MIPIIPDLLLTDNDFRRMADQEGLNTKDRCHLEYSTELDIDCNDADDLKAKSTSWARRLKSFLIPHL